MLASDRPYLSIVATSRNDNHGGNLRHRMQLFVNGVLEQCRRHSLSAELILVEWNPPADQPRLAEALAWPVEDGPCKVRIIEVSSEIHLRFKHSDKLPLFQMIAKNVGIRRARGQFVLATNIDILFSDEIMSFFASGKMSKRHMYRVDRYDVPSNIAEELTIEQQLAFCHNNVIRTNQRYETCNPAFYSRNGKKMTWTWRDWRRWPITNETRNFVYGPLEYLKGFRERLREYSPALEALQDRLFPNSLPRYLLIQIPVNLHTNACGDFTLMAAERWAAIRGYPELEVFSMHLDSLLCYAAHHSGARQKVLADPMRIYHIEHGIGSGWTPEGEEVLYKRIDSAGISRLEADQIRTWALEMRRKGRPIMFNSENWGLADDDLPETVIPAAGK